MDNGFNGSFFHGTEDWAQYLEGLGREDDFTLSQMLSSFLLKARRTGIVVTSEAVELAVRSTPVDAEHISQTLARVDAIAATIEEIESLYDVTLDDHIHRKNGK